MSPPTATGTDLNEVVVKKVRELPPLPLVVQKLLTVMRNPACSAADVTAVLSSDQALTSMLLKLVNSSFYGMSGKVSTVSRAVVVLGHATVRNLALGLGAARSLAHLGEQELQCALWNHALVTAAAAEALAQDGDYPNPEEAYIAGLLHDIGRILLHVAAPEIYAPAAAAGPAGLAEREMAELRIDHPRAARKLLRHWKLPDNLIEAVRFHHVAKVALSGEAPLVTLVTLADVLSAMWPCSCEASPSDAEFRQLVAAAGHDLRGVAAVLPRVVDRVEQTRGFLEALDLQDTTPHACAVPEQVVVVGNDAQAAAWLTAVLAFHGCRVVPMNDYFAKPGVRAATNAVVIDARSLSAEHWRRIDPALDHAHTRVFAVAEGCDEPAAAACLRTARHLPLVFSAAHLAAD